MTPGASSCSGVREIGRFPEFDLGGSDVDPQIRTQLILHPFDEKSADMIHMQVRQHDISDACKIDLGSGQSLDQLSGPRQMQVRVQSQPGVDKNGLLATLHDDHVQRPVESVRRQEHVAHPGGPDGGVCVMSQHGGWEWQHAIADHQHVDVADLHCIARRNEFVMPRLGGG
jgi:hypothetical protein